MENTVERVGASLITRAVGEGRTFDLLGARFLVKTECAETDGVFSILQMDIPPGAGVPLHHHPFAEIFYVIAGRLDFAGIHDGAERWTAIGPGETASVPSGVSHGLLNSGSEYVRLLVVVTARQQGFFDDVGVAANPVERPAPATEEEIQRVVQTAARYEMFLG